MVGMIAFRPLGVPCEPGKWVHVALVRDRGSLQFWMNGRLAKDLGDVRGAQDAPWPVLDRRRAGKRRRKAYSFDGQIDEVRLSEFGGPFMPEMLLWPEGRQTAGKTNHDDPAKKGGPAGIPASRE